jgi:polysaccharide pyruvyl transferase CsaB
MASPQLATAVLICGYYGEHNLGDDALLAVLLDQLPRGCRPVVTARDQEQVRQRFGVETTDRTRLGGVLQALGGCDALVLGGGSLLQDATSLRSLIYYAVLMAAARLQGKPVILWAQGLGPLRRRRSQVLVRALLPQATAISWRDGASAALARGWGVEAVVGSDPVWSLARHTPWHGAGGPIVLCWRPVTHLSAQGWATLLQALARLAPDRPVLWLPFHQEQDRGLLRGLDQQGLVPEGLRQRSSEVHVADPQGALDLFAGAGLVLAMRLHGLILAALAGSPCAALSYDPKVSAAASAIGCGDQDLAQPQQVEDLLQQWQAVLDQPPSPAAIEAQRVLSRCHQEVLLMAP